MPYSVEGGGPSKLPSGFCLATTKEVYPGTSVACPVTRLSWRLPAPGAILKDIDLPAPTFILPVNK